MSVRQKSIIDERKQRSFSYGEGDSIHFPKFLDI